jgi:hypothetical protein
MNMERGIVPCGICHKWVLNDVKTKDENGLPVHPACLNKVCDFCTNPKRLTVGLYWDIEKDDNMFMCEDCKKKRIISEPNKYKSRFEDDDDGALRVSEEEDK